MGRTARSVQLSATAAATIIVAAACSSSGTVGTAGGTKINLDTVSAADAVKAASAAQTAKHTVRVHNVQVTKNSTQTIDGVQSTDREALVSTSLSQNKAGPSPSPSPSPEHGEIRLDAPALYLDDPGLPDRLRHGERWIKLDLDHLPPKDSADKDLAFFARLGGIYRGEDPKQGSLFALTMPDLHRVGVETRDGRRLLHLQGSMTPQTLPATPPPGSGLTQAYLDARRAQLTQQGVTKTDLDLWLGEDALPVEVKQTVEGGPIGTVTSDITQSDWGAQLVVTPPPADQTYAVPAQ